MKCNQLTFWKRAQDHFSSFHVLVYAQTCRWTFSCITLNLHLMNIQHALFLICIL